MQTFAVTFAPNMFYNIFGAVGLNHGKMIKQLKCN